MSMIQDSAGLSRKKAILLTVGTGTADEIEKTIIGPFRKSFEAGEWDRILLLPSKETEGNARLLQSRFGQFPIEVHALPKAGDEENTDSAFRYFDSVIAGLLAAGFRAEDCTADITRGTKAMTAALALAAMTHRLGKLRYIAARRDKSGMAVPGTERVDDAEPRVIARRRDLNLAHAFLRAANFRAAEQLLTEAEPKGHLREELRWTLWAAQFWGAWDRFDYKSARKYARRDGLPQNHPGSIEEFLPSQDQIQVLEILSGDEPPRARDNALSCRMLAADLLANAERRLQEGHNEEVLVRLYRVLELLGQCRLFEYGIDSANVPSGDPRVQQWLQAAGRPDPGPEPLKLARLDAAKLLDFLERTEGPARGLPPIGSRLADLKWLGDFGPEMRNTSVLIHGFRARTRGRGNELRQLLQDIIAFFSSEDDGNPQRLNACRFAFLADGGAGNLPGTA